jgi:hypothetical protein
MLDFKCLVLVAVWLNCIEAVTADLRTLGPQDVNLWRLNIRGVRQRPMNSNSRLHNSPDGAQQILFDHGSRIEKASKKYDFRAQWFEQPLDHFDRTSKHKFHQRYWVNSRHYKPRKGAPVIVLDGGETSGEVCCLLRTAALLMRSAFVGSSAILGHRHCRNIGPRNWRTWCCTRA